MYICNECGHVFDEPYEYYETHGLDTPPYEKWSVCPRCKEAGFVEAKECDRCGRLCAELHDDLCEYCFDDLFYER